MTQHCCYFNQHRVAHASGETRWLLGTILVTVRRAREEIQDINLGDRDTNSQSTSNNWRIYLDIHTKTHKSLALQQSLCTLPLVYINLKPCYCDRKIKSRTCEMLCGKRLCGKRNSLGTSIRQIINLCMAEMLVTLAYIMPFHLY